MVSRRPESGARSAFHRVADVGHGRAAPAAVGAVTWLAVTAFVLGRALRLGGVGRFVLAGSRWVMGDAVGVPVAPGNGYDGQFVYALAHAPLTAHSPVGGVQLDAPAYRAGRVLLPLAAHGLGGLGVPLPTALVAINVVAMVVAAACTTALLTSWEVSGWWSVAVTGTPGLLLGVARDTTEPLAWALLCAALLAARRRSPVAVAVLGSLAVLARETTVAPLLALAMAGLVLRRTTRRPFDRATLLGAAVPLVVLIAWQVRLHQVWQTWPVTSGRGNLGLPLLGPLRDTIWPYRPPDTALSLVVTWELERLWLLALLLGALVLLLAAHRRDRPVVGMDGPAAPDASGLPYAVAVTVVVLVAVSATAWQEDAGFLRVAHDAAGGALMSWLVLGARSTTRWVLGFRRALLGVTVLLSAYVALLYVANP